MKNKPGGENPFAKISAAARGTGAAPAAGPAVATHPPAAHTPPALPDAPPPRRPGRPPGKRSDPGFIQATAYLPAELHHGVKMALLQEREGREFSELVAELLAGWLASRPTA